MTLRSMKNLRTLGSRWRRFWHSDACLEQKIEELTEDPKACCQAGREWEDDIFDILADDLICAVAGDSESSYEAGRDWRNDRFDRGADRIIEGVTRNPESNLKAFVNWDYERWCDDRIVEGVVKDSKLSLRAGRDWKEYGELLEWYKKDHCCNEYISKKIDRVEKTADRIILTVARDPESSYEAGRDWNDELFNRGAERLIFSVIKDERQKIKAYQEWPEERVMTLLQADAPGLADYIREDPKHGRILAKFARRLGPELMQKFPVGAFYSAMHLYETHYFFSGDVKPQEEFYIGLRLSANKGNVSEWADEIVKSYKT